MNIGRLFFISGVRTLALIVQVVLPLRVRDPLHYLYRLLVLSLFLALFVPLQLLHWLGFLLDEIIFGGYRQVAVREPVFVLGVPRSGTTFSHRLLARDDAFTTLSTWECLFAPSITERHLWQGLGRLDRLVGRPLARLVALLEDLVCRWLEEVHPSSLAEPEEDYLVFLPVLCAFILVVPFPDARWVWRMGTFDRDMPTVQRQQLMRWYRSCLQRHLYFHGQGLTLLSKNASFAGMAHALVDTFPDCKVVLCERDPLRATASQLRALQSGLGAFGYRGDDPFFSSKLVDCLQFYYQNLQSLGERLPRNRLVTVPMWELSQAPRRCMERIYGLLPREVPQTVDVALQRYESQPARHTPVATPALSTWGLDEAELTHRFAAWRPEETLRL